MTDALASILETKEAERLATGFVFTEGPLWHPDGFYYFVDVRSSVLYRIVPGRAPDGGPREDGGRATARRSIFKDASSSVRETTGGSRAWPPMAGSRCSWTASKASG
jgi:Gluconolactonase